jgi:tetratricopeptide (TPR) repeat protein
MRRKLLLLLLLIVSFGCCQLCAAQGPQSLSAQMTAANELLNAEKWEPAAAAYQAILQTEPKNAAAWYQLATARYSLKQYAQAAEAFEKNVGLTDSGFAMYNLACVYSLMNEREKAIQWLTKTVDNPKTVLPAVRFDDSDLTNIKDDPRTKALADKVDRTIHPCMYSTEARQFDFWVGEWDVYNPQGRKVGSSVIQSFAAGCGVLENWTDGFGGTGKSINFYDPNEHKWYQYWMGQNGSPSRYSGVYKDGAIRYIGEPYTLNGQKITPRLTFFNLDTNTVRQFAEKSDDGKIWNTVYDFKYVRKVQNK